MKRFLILAGAAVVIMVLLRKSVDPPTLITGRAMGCEWKLVTDEMDDPQVLRAEIAAVLEHWEQVLSTWRADSDLSRTNRGEPPSADLRRVLDLAEQLRHNSRGAFDHRMLGKLTAAGFGPGGDGCDLSSLGKGFAVDRVCELLARRGIRRHVFSLAGEVRAGDGNWPITLESPVFVTGAVAETIVLSGKALATSGNYRQSTPASGGRLASHILDPATGEPVLRRPCAVTVIGPDAALASGWATALFVLGPAGNPLAESAGYQVIWQGEAE